jgi:hypothetical protein
VTKFRDELHVLIEKKQNSAHIYTGIQFIGLESLPDAVKLLSIGEDWGEIAVTIQECPRSKLTR